MKQSKLGIIALLLAIGGGAAVAAMSCGKSDSGDTASEQPAATTGGTGTGTDEVTAAGVVTLSLSADCGTDPCM